MLRLEYQLAPLKPVSVVELLYTACAESSYHFLTHPYKLKPDHEDCTVLFNAMPVNLRGLGAGYLQQYEPGK